MSERSTILVSVHCPDRPGITAGLMQILTDSSAEIYDVEQIVVRGRLTLNLLIGVTGEKGTIRDLLFHGWENDIHFEFEVVEETPTPQKLISIVSADSATIVSGVPEFRSSMVSRRIFLRGAFELEMR